MTTPATPEEEPGKYDRLIKAIDNLGNNLVKAINANTRAIERLEKKIK